jgi:uncharacterized protein
MKAAYLIDGYNLIHAIGLLPKRAGPHGLEKARAALLELLHRFFGTQSAEATVVFDAAKAPPGVASVQEIHGINVRFATQGQLADDVIEAMIRADAAPKRLVVISNDHRLQTAARRREARVMKCEEFLDLLFTRRPAPARPAGEAEPEKNTEMTDAERDRWLKEFGYLDKDLGDLDFRF